MQVWTYLRWESEPWLQAWGWSERRLRAAVSSEELATATRAQTTPSREYIHVGTRVIAIEVPTPAVGAPTFPPAGGNYHASADGKDQDFHAGATIRYTLDGTTPTDSNGIVGTSV
jgi:Chitobiase/beta-hexosaminidase C-terminal domain